MRKIGLFVVLLGMCAVAQAGVTPLFENFQCDFPDDNVTHSWVFTGDNNAGYALYLSETYFAVGQDRVYMSGTTNEDPTFHIQKTVTNDNGHDWTGYSLTLGETSNNVTFDYTVTPTAILQGDGTVFTVDVSDPTQLVFSGGTLAVGQTLVMDFDINVADIGNFSYCMTQLAIPEPATLTMLGLGSLALLVRRKRAA